MALSHVLIAYDGSSAADAAIDMVAELLSPHTQTTLAIVNVVAIPLLTEDQMMNFGPIIELMRKDATALLQDATKRLEQYAFGSEIDTYLLSGSDPALEITKLAVQLDTDLVVIGSRGLGGIKGYLGSVGHKLISACPCAVLIAKEEPAEA